ncbi:MAG: pyrimidine-nucleoside phosphorylase, partial [Anaerolineae bacterium]|nr:pyrimidine-nucleoside phosphorylase [Anaerolineae bacterium]
GVGLEVHVKVGDKLETGMPLVTIHAHAQSQLAPCRQRLEQATLLSDTPVEPFPLFYGTIYGR